MNPIASDNPIAPPRSSFSCDRHVSEQFNGFCPSCLCERLTTLDNSSSNTNTPSSSSSRRPIKSLFSSKPPKPSSSKTTSFLPELRRSKSFSASKNEALGPFFEPQRKSCDVSKNYNKPSSSFHQNSIKIESCGVNEPVFAESEDGVEYRDAENVEDDDENGDEIRPVLSGLCSLVEAEVNSGGIVEEVVMSVSGNLKPMKDHIDLDSYDGKKRSGGGGFWAAASVFSKKWQSWKRKQKGKKQSSGVKVTILPVEKPISRQYRETQSEIADYGYGRRSCDTEPRFSLDVGRMSFDGPRYSFDAPRASWDGNLMGRSFPRMAPPMVSVVEDTPRCDMLMPMEEPIMNGVNEDENVPGGSVQTRDYYLDSSSKRRRSLDRSSSIRKTAASVVAEMDELKMVCNPKVSPTTTDYANGVKILVGEQNTRNSNANSLRDDCSETFELGSRIQDSSSSVIGNGDRMESKKSRKWSWKLWGLINRRNGGNKDADEEKNSRVNGMERSLSSSWQDSRREGNGDIRGGFNRKMFRSNSSTSWRNAPIGVPFENARKSSAEMDGHGKKRRDEFVQNHSPRYSPNHVDNGLLRFYLQPLRGSRRGLSKIKPNNSNSIARSILRLN